MYQSTVFRFVFLLILSQGERTVSRRHRHSSGSPDAATLKLQQTKRIINLDCNGVLLKGDVSHDLESYLANYQGPLEELESSLLRLAQTTLFPSVQPLIHLAATPRQQLKLAIRTFGHDMYQVDRELRRMKNIPESFQGIPLENRFQIYWLSPKYASAEFLLVRGVWGDGSLIAPIACGDDQGVEASIDRLLVDWGRKISGSTSKNARMRMKWDVKLSDALSALGCSSPNEDDWGLAAKINSPLANLHTLPDGAGVIKCHAIASDGNQTNNGEIHTSCVWVKSEKKDGITEHTDGIAITPCEEVVGFPLFGPIACVLQEQLHAYMSARLAWKAWAHNAASLRVEFHDASSLARFFKEELSNQVGITAIRDHFVAHHSSWCTKPGFFRYLWCVHWNFRCKMCHESGGYLSDWKEVNGKIFFPDIQDGKPTNLFFDDNLDNQHIVSALLPDASGTRLSPDDDGDVSSAVRQALIHVPKDRERNMFPSEQANFFVDTIRNS